MLTPTNARGGGQFETGLKVCACNPHSTTNHATNRRECGDYGKTSKGSDMTAAGNRRTRIFPWARKASLMAWDSDILPRRASSAHTDWVSGSSRKVTEALASYNCKTKPREFETITLVDPTGRRGKKGLRFFSILLRFHSWTPLTEQVGPGGAEMNHGFETN